jgi:hypothetical protein
VGAADRDLAPSAQVRQSGAFASIALTAPAVGWPPVKSVAGRNVVAGPIFRVPFQHRSAVWRYHVVLKAGDADASDYTITYDAPLTGPYPNGITFDPVSAPGEVTASFPGRTIATFASSEPLPFHQIALPKTALRRAGRTVIADLPNPSRQPVSAGISDVLVELR